MDILQEYSLYFSSLNRATMKGQKAPHKIILLLAIIDLVGQEYIKNTHIVLDDHLKNRFNTLWERYVGRSSVFNPVARTPFFHMDYEPFWRLCKSEPREPLSALMSEELFKLLQGENNRAYFRRLLISLI